MRLALNRTLPRSRGSTRRRGLGAFGFEPNASDFDDSFSLSDPGGSDPYPDVDLAGDGTDPGTGEGVLQFDPSLGGEYSGGGEDGGLQFDPSLGGELDSWGSTGGSTGGSSPDASDQFISFLTSLGKDAAQAALKWGIKEGTKAASDYVSCLSKGGNADTCAQIIQNASAQGAKTVAIDTLKTRIINLQNEIEKLKAALASNPGNATLINQITMLQNALMQAINELAGLEGSPGMGAGVGTQGADFSQTYLTPAQQQQLMIQSGYLPAKSGGWLSGALVPTAGGVGLGALAGYYYKKQPMHALIGAGVGGVLGYLLTSLVGGRGRSAGRGGR